MGLSNDHDPDALRAAADRLYAQHVAEGRAAQEAAEADLDRRLREGLIRYREDPAFHNRVRIVCQVLELRRDISLTDILPGETRHEVFLGMALQAVVAMEIVDGMQQPRLCGQQHHAVDGGSPCIARGEHTTHTTASGKSWRSA